MKTFSINLFGSRYLGCFNCATRVDSVDNEASNELNALVWCDHTDPALIQPFEEKHNVKVNLKEYEGTGAALAIVEQSHLAIGMFLD